MYKYSCVGLADETYEVFTREEDDNRVLNLIKDYIKKEVDDWVELSYIHFTIKQPENKIILKCFDEESGVPVIEIFRVRRHLIKEYHIYNIE